MERGGMRAIDYSLSMKYGVWWIKACGLMIMLKAPWSQTLFSERYGHRKFWPRRGWRIGIRKNERELFDIVHEGYAKWLREGKPDGQ